MTYEQFLEAVQTIADSHVDYVTTHADSGSDYAEALTCDGDIIYSGAAARLRDFLEAYGHEVTEEEADQLLDDVLSYNLDESVPGHCFLRNTNHYYSKDQYYTYLPKVFEIASWPVQEVHTEILLDDLWHSILDGRTTMSDLADYAQRAHDSNDLCLSLDLRHSRFTAIDATEAVWHVTVSLEALVDAMEELAL